MAESTNEPVNPVDPVDNGESRSNARALMVRDYDANMMTPYMGQAIGSPYLEGTPGGINFSQLYHALRRRWIVAICAGFLIGLPLAAAVWLVTPENYECVAWLHVGDPPSLSRSSNIRNPTEYEQYRKTQSARIRSPLVLNAALNKPGIAELEMLRTQSEPLKFLEDEVIVVSPLESEVLQIKMRGKDARQLVRIVNAVKDSYLEHVVAAERQKTLRRKEMLENQYKDNMAELSNKRTTMYQLQKTHSSPDQQSVKMKQNLLLGQTNQLWFRVLEQRALLTDVRTKIAVMKEREAAGNTLPEQELELEMAKDEMIREYMEYASRIRQALEEQAGLSKRGGRDPAVGKMAQMLDRTQRQLEERRAELRPQLMHKLQREIDKESGIGNIATLESREKILASEVAALEEQYNKVSTEVAELSDDSADVDMLLAEIKQTELNTAKLASDLDEMKIELSLPPRVNELEPATVPEGTNPIFRYALTILAGISGLILGAGTVVALEYQARRLNTSTELGTNVGLRVLGTMPNLASLSRAKGLNGSAMLQGILAESVDSVRTILLRHSPDDAPHVIMISSAGDREGKTTVASQLAASLARAGRRTLLIDGDLRSPSAHLTFEAANEPGVCEVLRGEVDLSGAIQPTAIDGLMLMAAGQCDYNSIAALAKEPLEDLLHKVREQFEFVVIDAAPVLIYADTLLMGVHVDAAVLSARRDVSQLHKIYEAKERLESVGIRVMGAVVNGITETNRRPAFALPASTD